MKILYISDHAVLEYDEVKLFTELGHDVFSLGAYHNLGHPDLPRPAVKGLKYYENLDHLYIANPNRLELHPGLIEWADVIIVMHSPNVIVENWERIKHKRVIWRSIGQSLANIETKLLPARNEGLQIVRYSPKELNIAGYIGEDAIIRFYKDENEFDGWSGESRNVVAFAQSLKGRREFCHYDEIMMVIEKFNGKVYGPGNEDLGKYNGGAITYEQQINKMQNALAMPYGGTWPAAYTLSFIEALMMGLPIVAISKSLAHISRFEELDFYEVDEILAKISGIVCDTPEAMIHQVSKILSDPGHANNIANKQRELAIKMFGKETIMKQWRKFLGSS